MKLGKGFSDTIFLGRLRRKEKVTSEQLMKDRIDNIGYPSRFSKGKKIGVLPFFALFILCFFLLIIKLFFLQILEGKHNRTLANENRIKLVKRRAPRGIIFDREGRPVVRNSPVFRLKCFNQEGDCEERIISREEALELEIKGQGSRVQVEQTREYLYPYELAHVLGFVGEVSAQELENQQERLENRYQAGDMVGKMGVEKQFDLLLRGEDGGEIVEVDNQGRILRQVGMREPAIGSNLYLSLDLELQKKVVEAMDEKAGAVVAIDPKNGEILALYSSPSFDPNSFTFSKEKEVEAILKDEERRPMFSRAISGVYHPGSTFKIVTVVAGVEEGKVDETTQYDDPGEIKIGEWRYGNWYFDKHGKKEGVIGVVRAIARSTDTFFYKIGEWVGVEKLASWARRFGLGQVLGIDLPGEVGGLVADAEWKERVKGEQWFLGNTYHMSIGQGDTLMTPLQVGVMTQVLANKGKLCKPHVLKDKKVSCKEIGISKKTLDLVTEGLKQACEEGGTAFPFFDFKVEREGKEERIYVAGKTGTAEYGDPQDRTHAWFTAFSPVDDPQIAVTVLVEGGGEGSYVAAPIVKELMNFWLQS